MTIKNKETLEKLRTYQIGVIRSVITSRQGCPVLKKVYRKE